MQKNERIELIKAAAMLTAASLQSERIAMDYETPVELFDYYYDYLQLKLEASGNDTSN